MIPTRTPIAEDYAAIAARLAEIKPQQEPAPRRPWEHTPAELEAIRREWAAGKAVTGPAA